jgi:ABC-type bacteriocin/lantibiotic exporter with double-glycine peptidase domain
MSSSTIGPTIVRQRRRSDCGLAALANLLQVTYEDAYVEAVKVSAKGVRTNGLLMRELVEIAKRLGRQLRPLHFQRVRALLKDEEQWSGILGINWTAQHDGCAKCDPIGHWVTVHKGVVMDPDDNPPRAYDPDEYIALHPGRWGYALVEVNSPWK